LFNKYVNFHHKLETGVLLRVTDKPELKKYPKR